MSNISIQCETIDLFGMVDDRISVIRDPHLNTTNCLYRFNGNYSSIFLNTYEIISRTPCGVWIDDYGKKRFVLSNARKRFAYPTEAEAAIAFRARKKKQVQILKQRLKEAEQFLLASNDLVKMTKDEKALGLNQICLPTPQ